MDVLASDELRLLYAILLNAAVIWASWRFTRRWSADAIEAAADAGLLFYLVQYVSVCGPGVVGALHRPPPLPPAAPALRHRHHHPPQHPCQHRSIIFLIINDQ